MTLRYADVMKPEDISIAYLWTIFAGVVLSPGASQVQRDEMRKSFYAGFVEGFNIIDDLSNGVSEEEAFKTLNRLHEEAGEFFEALTPK